jgi:hypothetical protein
VPIQMLPLTPEAGWGAKRLAVHDVSDMCKQGAIEDGVDGRLVIAAALRATNNLVAACDGVAVGHGPVPDDQAVLARPNLPAMPRSNNTVITWAMSQAFGRDRLSLQAAQPACSRRPCVVPETYIIGLARPYATTYSIARRIDGGF